MKRKINRYLISLVLVALFSAFFSAGLIYHFMYQKQIVADLRQQTELLADIFSSGQEIAEQLHSQDPGFRLTVIREDGQVLFDTCSDSSRMENHLDRKEIRNALEKGEGCDVRQSDTLGRAMYYYAVCLEDGSILRISKEEAGIWSVFYHTMYGMLIAGLLMMLVCLVFSRYLTESLIRPIDRMAHDIDRAAELNPYEEMMPFVLTIQKQHEAILKSADMRQEFTANVSHELKTPLTSISGYAELIQSGFANEKEIQHFAGEIRNNAQRLLTLINDIIRLSELDAQAEQTFERVELYGIAEKTIQILQMSAGQHQVNLMLTGEKTMVYANREMMEELIYNLCDNAIRYNKPGGRVVVCVSDRKGYGELTVRDTGIGIPEECRERIFERFYRVDKSRSKATGGTGLGLAIVKHIVMQHGAQIQVESQVGEGTTMKVSFCESWGQVT